MLSRENLNFQNLRNASFCHSGTDVCIITDPVTTKLKGNFFGYPPPPLKKYFLAGLPSNSTTPPARFIKNKQSLNWSKFKVVTLFIYLFIYLFILLLKLKKRNVKSQMSGEVRLLEEIHHQSSSH